MKIKISVSVFNTAIPGIYTGTTTFSAKPNFNFEVRCEYIKRKGFLYKIKMNQEEIQTGKIPRDLYDKIKEGAEEAIQKLPTEETEKGFLVESQIAISEVNFFSLFEKAEKPAHPRQSRQRNSTTRVSTSS